VKKFPPFIIFMLFLFILTGCTSASMTPTLESTATLHPLEDSPTPAKTSSSPILLTVAPSGPTATPFVHIVQQGETLLGIAIRYGVSLDDLLLVNPGVDPRILSVGQNLRIPGPGGEPVDMLLPSPTPIPLDLDLVYCYPTTGEYFRCLLKVTNSIDDPVEGVAVLISIFNGSGDLRQQAQASSLTRTIPPSQETILEARFNLDPDQSFSAQAELISAVQVSNPEERLIEVMLSELKVEKFSDDRLYQFEGLIELQEDRPQGDVNLTIQAFGYNADGEPVGTNALQVSVDASDFPFPFTLSLFSLAKAVEDFEFLVEAQSSIELE
jgi:LysM repeat protein